MKGHSRKKVKRISMTVVAFSTAVIMAAGAAVTALAGQTYEQIEPLAIQTPSDATPAAETSEPIIIIIENEKLEPANLGESGDVSESEAEEESAEMPEDAEEEPQEVFRAASTRSLSSSDQQMLLKVAMAEAEDQGTKGMALVMNVVLNRVASSRWPNNVHDVIYQKSQFEVISNGRYNRVTPNAGCYEALNMVMNGWDESQGAEYFCMSGSSKWHERHLTRLFQYRDHVFYR